MPRFRVRPLLSGSPYLYEHTKLLYTSNHVLTIALSPPAIPASSQRCQSTQAGAAAGTSVDLLFFPIDTIKTRLQSSQGFLAAGGFSGVYRGVGSVIVGSAPGGELDSRVLIYRFWNGGLLT